MTYVPIETLEIQNYGCIKNASFGLTPLHALIGPNDSGKSTTLRALRTVLQFAADVYPPRPDKFFDAMIGQNPKDLALRIRYSDRQAYAISGNQGIYEEISIDGRTQRLPDPRLDNRLGVLRSRAMTQDFVELARRVTTAAMIRFDPNALRLPSPQILAPSPVQFLDETGKGLASVYQAINSRDVDAFISIRDQVRAYFPTVQTILVPTIENNLVTIQARLLDGTIVEAAQMSEGMLYFLGYAALRYLERSSLILVEEPENGLHPSRIAEVMKILREISKTSQVVLATHSPLVVNELEGSEVTVVTRDAKTGTQARRLSEVPGFKEASEIYQPGEFWLSYANGKDEKPLLTGTPRE